MKAPKLVKTKKSQLKVPVTTAGRKMQFYRNSNRSGSIFLFKIEVLYVLVDRIDSTYLLTYFAQKKDQRVLIAGFFFFCENALTLMMMLFKCSSLGKFFANFLKQAGRMYTLQIPPKHFKSCFS